MMTSLLHPTIAYSGSVFERVTTFVMLSLLLFVPTGIFSACLISIAGTIITDTDIDIYPEIVKQVGIQLGLGLTTGIVAGAISSVWIYFSLCRGNCILTADFDTVCS